jgi:hypothetical protein
MPICGAPSLNISPEKASLASAKSFLRTFKKEDYAEVKNVFPASLYRAKGRESIGPSRCIHLGRF